MPLVVSNRVLGVLHLGSLIRGTSRDDVDLLEPVVDRVGLAIEHGRLSRPSTVADRLEDLQAVPDATLVISASTSF